MKKLFYYFGVIILLTTICSCANDVTTNSVEMPNQTLSGYGRNEDINSFMSSIDSLNLSYMQETRTSSTTAEGFNDFQKTYLNNNYSKIIADAGGYVVGRLTGKYIGGALGSLTGNPMGTIGGYILGLKFGGLVMSRLCSYVAYRITDKGHYVTKNDIQGLEKNSFIVKSDINKNSIVDSIGILHNIGMNNMIEKNTKYTLSNNMLDYETMFNDCVNELKETGLYDKDIATNPQFKAEAIRMAQESATIANACYNGNISADEMYNKIIQLAQTFKGVEEEDIKPLIEFGKKVNKTCTSLSPSQLETYTNDLSNVIQGSNASSEFKSEVSSTANIILNSSYYWEKLK